MVMRRQICRIKKDAQNLTIKIECIIFTVKLIQQQNNRKGKKMKRKLKIITEQDVLNSKTLCKALNVSKSDIENNEISDFFIDCDHIKRDGEFGRGDFRFVTITKNKSTLLIVCQDEPDDKEIQMLNDYFNSKNFKAVNPNTWEKWDTIKTGIAYRGGAGYCYSLSEYTK
jgi:hypothetical protein